MKMPVYSFETYTRTDQTREINPAGVVLLEGILIFEDKRIRDLLDIKIFVDTDADVRIMRTLSCRKAGLTRSAWTFSFPR